MSETLKTRLLRRFEAEATVCATDAGAPPLGFYSPFGPLIAKAEVSTTLVQQLNAFADSVITPARAWNSSSRRMWRSAIASRSPPSPND